MPIIHVTTWAGQSDEQSRALTDALTATAHHVTGAPLDKITVYISEILRSRWSEGGSLGSDPDFAVRSRRLCYENDVEGAER